MIFKKKAEVFPGGTMDGNLPANAGYTGLIPGLGGVYILRSSWVGAPQLLSSCATTTEAWAPRACAPQQRSHCLPQLEKASTQQRRSSATKKRKVETSLLCYAKSLQLCPTLRSHPWDSPGKNTGVGCHFLLQCIKEKSETSFLNPSLNRKLFSFL